MLKIREMNVVELEKLNRKEQLEHMIYVLEAKIYNSKEDKRKGFSSNLIGLLQLDLRASELTCLKEELKEIEEKEEKELEENFERTMDYIEDKNYYEEEIYKLEELIEKEGKEGKRKRYKEELDLSQNRLEKNEEEYKDVKENARRYRY